MAYYFKLGQLPPKRHVQFRRPDGALHRILGYKAGHDRVWITRREDIARHWMAVHPAG